MQVPPRRGDVAKAWTETKLAVRAYSRNPNKANESQVRIACSHLRDESTALARRPPKDQPQKSTGTHG